MNSLVYVGNVSHRCDSLHAEKMQLYGNELGGSVPSEIGLLSRLEVLEPEVNAMVGEIPEELCQLTTLEADCRQCVRPGCCTACFGDEASE